MDNGRVIEIRNCVKDIVYFAENYYTSADLTGIKKLPLFKAQKRVLKGMVKNQNIVTLGARQVGLTTLNGIYALWEALFFTDSNIVIMSHKMQCAETIMDRIKLAYDKMPNWLKPEAEIWTKRHIKFKNGSSIRVSASNRNACVGMTVSTLIIDNAAFIRSNDMEDIWNSMYPIISSTKHSRIILSSCPNNPDDKFAEMCNCSKRSCNKEWHFDSIKWHDVHGRDKRWKNNMIKCVGIDAFRREFECEFI